MAKRNKDKMNISKVKCEHCGYIFVPPFPEDCICIKCGNFSANLFDFINGKSNYLRDVSVRDIEIQQSRNIKGTKRRKSSDKPAKLFFYGIVSKDRKILFYSNDTYYYILELTNNLDFIATGTLSGTLDKMLIILEDTQEDEPNTVIARFHEKNGNIHILIGNFSDKDSSWIFNQVSLFFFDYLRKNKVSIENLSDLEKDKIAREMKRFLKYLEQENELKVKFEKASFDLLDDWLRLDYFGLSAESVGVISCLLDSEDHLTFNEQQQFESDSEKIEFRESVMTAKIEAILAIIRGNMKGFPRWISIRAGYQKYRYLSFMKLPNKFFFYCVTEGNIEKLDSLESFFKPHLKTVTSKKFTGSLKIFNALKKRLRALVRAIPDRTFF